MGNRTFNMATLQDSCKDAEALQFLKNNGVTTPDLFMGDMLVYQPWVLHKTQPFFSDGARIALLISMFDQSRLANNTVSSFEKHHDKSWDKLGVFSLCWDVLANERHYHWAYPSVNS